MPYLPGRSRRWRTASGLIAHRSPVKSIREAPANHTRGTRAREKDIGVLAKGTQHHNHIASDFKEADCDSSGSHCHHEREPRGSDPLKLVVKKGHTGGWAEGVTIRDRERMEHKGRVTSAKDEREVEEPESNSNESVQARLASSVRGGGSGCTAKGGDRGSTADAVRGWKNLTQYHGEQEPRGPTRERSESEPKKPPRIVCPLDHALTRSGAEDPDPSNVA
ncbi:hypothetical protein DFP72DRAFT_847796 [Ephemerocybe angulata]|uniref:Uncharacterized protein n=1 Tax=Ephemerocybe angulata TaxID=980116 RepID=A0A8H6HZD1_9AGAR|nr:hypothetical protein DFP72DRAFT_847796 [Tulosesus angulatus]